MSEQSKQIRLVIVESPAKARTIGKYLGAGYRVRASVGHIRDLPERELGVDVENGFEPKYVTIRGKGKVIQELRREAERADEVLLATDPDREGEAIAYHVAEQLGYGDGADGADGVEEPEGSGHGRARGPRFRRVLFHEITRDAVRAALEHPTALDMKKVEAQQARRILDRLVGYQVSPLLWKPIRPGLSAGRVQTVALRLIAEREVEIRAFVPQEYWSILAELEKDGQGFGAKLHHIDGKAFHLENEERTRTLLADIEGHPFVVGEVKRRERTKAPPAPFTTSTLQQEAAKRLGFSPARTMRVAQQLYEGVELGSEGSVGLITYMRTDSTRVAAPAAAAARDWALRSFGERYVPAAPRLWQGRQQKGAQEAHEAIRPTEVTHRPESVKKYLDRDQARLYELVWLRFVAGQMENALYDTTTADFELTGRTGTRYLFRATGSVLKFDGFTRLYQEAREEGEHKTLDEEAPLPVLERGDRCRLLRLVPEQHFTQPPPRFTEASLVKELERLGIGRPSTYAQIIATLTDREYVEVKQKRFFPTPLGETVAQVLVGVFPDLFDVGFTSEMETELDKIEEGDLAWRRVLEQFYEPFQRQLQTGEQKSDAIVRDIAASETTEPCPECGRPLAVKWNRYGRFLACTGYPLCKYTQPLDRKESAQPKPIGEKCPLDGGELVERAGRYGPFISCSNYPKCKYTRPVTIPGLKCPECGEGDVGEKRTRRGKVFWGCTRYPDCQWSSWDRPIPGPCPDCGSPYLVVKSTKARGDFIKCPRCKGEFAPESIEGGLAAVGAGASAGDGASSEGAASSGGSGGDAATAIAPVAPIAQAASSSAGAPARGRARAGARTRAATGRKRGGARGTDPEA